MNSLLLNKLKIEKPLVVHYTNTVTINDCAQVCLAIGGSPIMTFSLNEAEELIKRASSVVINIGCMKDDEHRLFFKAATIAKKLNKPVVLDPAGIGASEIRKNFVKQLLKDQLVTIIKGNASEIKCLGNLEYKSTGVDSIDEISIEEVSNIARKLNVVIVATGKNDYASDGTSDFILQKQNNPNMSIVCGTGCMLGTIIGCFVGIEENKMECVKTSLIAISIVLNKISKKTMGPLMFKQQLIDNLSLLNDNDFKKYERLKKFK